MHNDVGGFKVFTRQDRLSRGIFDLDLIAVRSLCRARRYLQLQFPKAIRLLQLGSRGYSVLFLPFTIPPFALTGFLLILPKQMNHLLFNAKGMPREEESESDLGMGGLQ